MARRHRGNMRGERYCGNKSKKEVHDLDNEKTNCQIDEIIDAGNDRAFNTLAEAHAASFDNCTWCLGSSRR